MMHGMPSARAPKTRVGGQTLAAKQLQKTLCRNLVFSNAVRLCVILFFFFCALVWSVLGLFWTDITVHLTFARGVETTARMGNAVQQVFSKHKLWIN